MRTFLLLRVASAVVCLSASAVHAQAKDSYRYCYAHNLEKPGGVYSQVVKVKVLADGSSPQGGRFYKNFESQLEHMGITTPVFCQVGDTAAEAEAKKTAKKADHDWFGSDIVASTEGLDVPPPPAAPSAPAGPPTLTLTRSEAVPDEHAQKLLDAEREFKAKQMKAKQEEANAAAQAEAEKKIADADKKRAEERRKMNCTICQ